MCERSHLRGLKRYLGIILPFALRQSVKLACHDKGGCDTAAVRNIYVQQRVLSVTLMARVCESVERDVYMYVYARGIYEGRYPLHGTWFT